MKKIFLMFLIILVLSLCIMVQSSLPKEEVKPLSEPCPSCYKIGYIDRLIYASEICEPQRVGVRKVPSGYKEVIKNIKKHYPGNTLNEDVWS